MNNNQEVREANVNGKTIQYVVLSEWESYGNRTREVKILNPNEITMKDICDWWDVPNNFLHSISNSNEPNVYYLESYHD